MKKIVIASSLIFPALTSLAADPLTNISGVLNRFSSFINLIIPFIVGLAVLVIVYGIFNFISSAGDEEARATAKQFIIWGIIGVFIMLSVWGLVNILVNSFGTNNASKDVNVVKTQVAPVPTGTVF